MRLHSFSAAHLTDRAHQAHYRDLMYTIMFIVGAPAVVMGSMYLVDTLFNLMWR